MADQIAETDETVALCVKASALYRLGQAYSAFGTIHDVAGPAGSPADNQPPIIVSAGSVPSTPVNGPSAPLSMLGADDGGEANLTYTWSIFGDAPGPVTFSDNAAKAVTATFTTSGTYRLQAVATDAEGLS